MENGDAHGMNRASWSRAWTEHRPTPLNLTDTEILDWLGEYCERAVYSHPSSQSRGGFTLYCYDIRTSAARWKEANE
jgi:hypothetical protein